jgi:hypothetical protein
VRGTLVAALGLVAIGLAAYWAFAFAAQRSMLFPRPVAAGAGGEVERAGGVRLWLEPGRVEAWFLPATSTDPEPRPLLLFAHGNGELIDHWASAFEIPRALGASVLLVEYPGYGRSGGSPSQASIAQAMVAAFDWAASQRSVDRARIVGYGRSLGGAAVCALARERELAALVLESTFTSARSFAARFGLPRFLVRDPFENVPVLRDFAGPVLVVHGERDEIVPPGHAEALRAAAQRAELHWLDCGHNDCPRPWEILRRFLAEHGLL